MPRTWTKESEAAWRQSRNEQRRSNGLCDFEDLSADDKAAALDDERKTILSLTEKRLKQEAWPLEKRPLQAYIAPCNGTIQLPSQFRDDKYDKVCPSLVHSFAPELTCAYRSSSTKETTSTNCRTDIITSQDPLSWGETT